MPENLWDTLITVIRGRPHKFVISLQELGVSSQDLRSAIPRVYNFEGSGQSNPNENLRFTVKVTDELIPPNIFTNEAALHDAVVSFGLESIRRAPDEREFVFTTKEFKRIRELPRKEGQELRVEILKFIYTANELWPSESVSSVDLQDNLIGTKEDTRHWLVRLQNEGLLEDARGFKKHSRARGKPDTKAYRIAAKARKEVINEINPVAEDIEYPANKFYILVDLEVEQKGPFVFVIMPFKDSEFTQQVYDLVIRPSVENNLECTCVRNDEDVWPGQLDDKFYSHIRKCQFLIAELSTENPNVVYELGLAHAFNKEVILLVDQHRRNGRLSFDYDKFGAIFYSNKEELLSRLQTSVRSLGTKLGIPLL